MNTTFVKLLLLTTGIILVAASFIVTIRYLTNSGVDSKDSKSAVVSVGSATGDTKINIKNPAQSTNFADIGDGVYVSDERQLGSANGYSFTYFADDDSFAIDVSGKPVALYREKASRYLLESLGISESEACKLRVYVGVSYSIDSSLSGKNLGLSFCPDSVEL